MNSPDTVYFLALSGGAWRGAVQYWVLHHLMRTYTYSTIYGVSVGSINGAMAAMGKLDTLLKFWEDVDGLRDYLSFRWFYLVTWALGLVSLLERLTGTTVMGGLYSMRGLHEKLLTHSRLSDIQTPFVAGVVSLNDGVYYELDTRDMKNDKRLAMACVASSCMAPFMTPPLLHLREGGDLEAGFDGGGRHIFPIPLKEAAAARADGKRVVIHAVGCMPLQRIEKAPVKEVSGLIELALRGLEIMQAEVYETDLLQLQRAAGPGGEVHVWLPPENPGKPFQADRATIQRRLELGKKMAEAGPLILPGI